MPLLLDIIEGRFPKQKSPKPLPEAHFVEDHWVHTKLPWNAATQELTKLFPRDARPDRPRAWYARLAGTHFPGQLPPGNGPFYIPAWTLEDGREGEQIIETLKKAGYKRIEAHVVYLPHNAEYLAVAMRAAGRHPWTANPITARAYIYPQLRRVPDKKLRPFNVERWGIRGRKLEGLLAPTVSPTP